MSNPTTSTISISATADDVRAVLFDIANYPSWSTSFKAATVISSDAQGRPTQVKLSVDAGALKDKPTLNFTADDNSFYTLIMADPDAPSRQNPKNGEWQVFI